MSNDSDIITLGARLSWELPSEMERVHWLLMDKRQIIFYGPPGTGKTHVALQLAAFLTGTEEARVFLQFHPSYSYEDFFEGYRPITRESGSMPHFEIVSGPLKLLAERAGLNPEKQHVLVIDEINRGNLAKIFGELYFLLEYRDEPLRLQYGGSCSGCPRTC